MSKELYVSLTPHETKVAVVEDDQLAEIYYERENEYTLAGSIYKGRVTRVLPGMQSAFVDVGLERDAFLYVSDFFEMEEDQEEFEPVNIAGPRAESREREERVAREEPQVQPHLIEPEEAEQRPPAPIVFEGPEPNVSLGEMEKRTDEVAGGERQWRGRGGRRRRGRRGGRGFPESKFTRGTPEEAPPEPPQPGYTPVILPGESIAKFAQPAPEEAPRAAAEPSGEREREPERERRPERRSREREQWGPPPGYQPIILPGESISKYQRLAQQQASATEAPPESEHVESASGESSEAISAAEPAVESTPTESPSAPEPPVIEAPAFQQEYAETPVMPQAEERAEATEPEPHSAQSEGKDQQRYEQMNVAGIFGGAEVTKAEVPSESSPAPEGNVEAASERATGESAEAQQPAQETQARAPESGRPELQHAHAGTIEEEEIEEEEADLPPLAESFDDTNYEELEEETLEPHSYSAERNGELAAVNEELTEAIEESEEEREAIEGYEGEEGREEDFEAAEPEEQEEEPADTRAELRAPTGTAGFQQRTQRVPFERRGRGRRGGRRAHQLRQPQRQAVMISDVLKAGQEILVQIAKEPIGKKGARITSHIALPGRFLVYMPTVNHIGVSRKIASDEERQRLKRIVMGERDLPGHGGFIVRTAAEGVDENELKADIRFLKGLWNEIKTRADNSKAPALIYHDLNLVERTLRDQFTEDFTHVWVDNEQEYERILRFVNRFQPSLVRRVRLYTKETPLFEQFGIAEEINKALKSKVWLKSGGYIVINQTEALVAIDVNTGKYVGKTQRLEDTIVKTNVDAIKEIVRQIRLRDLGGIIVIDFIDMDERKNRQKVMQALEEALKSDRAPSKVLQFNDFGLVAITRKRVKHSLERTLGTPCPYCTGTGLVKSVETICNEIYTEMKKMRRHFEGSEVLLRVNPEVAKALKGDNARWLNELEELTGRSIIVKPDPMLHQEQFDM